MAKFITVHLSPKNIRLVNINLVRMIEDHSNVTTTKGIKSTIYFDDKDKIHVTESVAELMAAFQE